MTAQLLGEQGISPQLVRHALGHFATGVTVVTSRAPDGAPIGTTASAVSSLSLSPPLLLVCLDRSSETLAAICSHGGFAINVLADRQQHLSANFARRGSAATWDEVRYRLAPAGNPHLDDVLAVLDCRLERRLDGGDHEILVGAVVAVVHGGDDASPLLHFRGDYTSLTGA